MSDVLVFEFQPFIKVRVINEDGDTWFALPDVLNVIGKEIGQHEATPGIINKYGCEPLRTYTIPAVYRDAYDMIIFVKAYVAMDMAKKSNLLRRVETAL